MRSDARCILACLAVLGLVTSPERAQSRIIMIEMCGGGPPIGLPIDSRGKSDCGKACHALCPRKRLVPKGDPGAKKS